MSNKQYEQLTFADDFMFCKVLSTNEDFCKELLELILEMADFLNYLRMGAGESDFVKKLDHEVMRARDHKEWRTEYMTFQMRLDEAREEGGLSQLKKTFFSFLIKKGAVSVDLEKKMKRKQIFLYWRNGLNWR